MSQVAKAERRRLGGRGRGGAGTCWVCACVCNIYVCLSSVCVFVCVEYAKYWTETAAAEEEA